MFERVAMDLASLAVTMLAVTNVSIASPPMSTPSRLEAQVLAELNFARSRPGDYAGVLRRYRARFVGDVAYGERDAVGEQTVEGPAAVDEAIRYVETRPPDGPLAWDDALAASAAEHAEDQRATGLVGHDGSDGSSFERRVSRHLRERSVVSEIISYGEPDQVGVVRQLIVDDGEEDRGHRIDLFEGAIRHAGVACRAHPVYGYSCVIDLSAD